MQKRTQQHQNNKQARQRFKIFRKHNHRGKKHKRFKSFNQAWTIVKTLIGIVLRKDADDQK